MLRISLSEYASSLLEKLESYLNADSSSVVEEAVIKLYESYFASEELQDREPESLLSVLDNAGLLKNTYRCYRLALSEDQRQEEVIEAYNEEDAWQQMAKLFPCEVTQGFEITKIEPIDFDNL
jgi:galactokinase